jgi:hypothetical protein
VFDDELPAGESDERISDRKTIPVSVGRVFNPKEYFVGGEEG